MSSEARRQQLIDVALEVVADRGFSGLTLRDVAARAGVAHSLVRHHFGSRDQLLMDTFDAAAADDSPSAIGPGGGARALAEYCEPPAERHYLTWIDAWSEAPRSPGLRATLVEHHVACQHYVRSALDDLVASGTLSAAAPGAKNTLDTAMKIVALLDGLAVQHYVLRTIDAPTHRRTRRRLVAETIGIPTSRLPRR